MYGCVCWGWVGFVVKLFVGIGIVDCGVCVIAVV